MIILEKPYVSELLLESLSKYEIPVLKNAFSEENSGNHQLNLLDEQEFKNKVTSDTKIYSNSENALGWVEDNLPEYYKDKKISIFKDKVEFRKLLKDFYPDFLFQEIATSEIENLDIKDVKTPFILKPAIGFFSMGVYKITNEQDLNLAKKDIKNNIEDVEDLYPKAVIDSTRFIIEECLDGEEYAIDAYYDSEGEPVILNILKHEFGSAEDVSDRAYFTSKEIIEEYIVKFTQLLVDINKKTNLTNFPFHLEVKVDAGKITPIEVNPLRFAGWCTTDVAYFAYGLNVYDYYVENKKPNWKELLKDKSGKIYSMIILDSPQDLDTGKIKKFDYEKVLQSFENPLELRKIDYHEYPVFGFVFTETKKESKSEIDRILKSDLLEYIELK